MNTQNPNAIVPIDGFSDTDPTQSPLRGPGYRFKDGSYFAFSEKVNVTGKGYAVIDVKRGWQKLEKDCAPAYLMREPGQPMPPQPHVDKADWPLNLNNQPEHPWKSTHYLYLLNTSTGEISTFWTNTVGGNIAVAALRDQVDFMRKHRPDAIPVIALQCGDMPTQYGGTKPRPHFEILGWKSAGPQLLTSETPLAEVEAPSLAEQLDDAIPDLGPETKNLAPAQKKKNKK